MEPPFSTSAAEAAGAFAVNTAAARPSAAPKASGLSRLDSGSSCDHAGKLRH